MARGGRILELAASGQSLSSYGSTNRLRSLRSYGGYGLRCPQREADGPMMTLLQASERNGLSASHLRLLCRTGAIPAEKVGRDWVIMISQAELAKVLKSRTRKNAKKAGK